MISYRESELMKDCVYIVNTGRGAIIEERALLSYLRSGKVRGAALDVFETEPLPDDSSLLGFKNLILSPHLAASSSDALKRLAVDAVKRTLEGLGICHQRTHRSRDDR